MAFQGLGRHMFSPQQYCLPFAETWTSNYCKCQRGDALPLTTTIQRMEVMVQNEFAKVDTH